MRCPCRMTGALRIGCSSWTSNAWLGKVYPEAIRQEDRLAAYASLFDAVEIEATYHRPPNPFVVEGWKAKTPANFRFTLKLTRDYVDPRKPVDGARLAYFTEAAKLREGEARADPAPVRSLGQARAGVHLPVRSPRRARSIAPVRGRVPGPRMVFGRDREIADRGPVHSRRRLGVVVPTERSGPAGAYQRFRLPTVRRRPPHDTAGGARGDPP